MSRQSSQTSTDSSQSNSHNNVILRIAPTTKPTLIRLSLVLLLSLGLFGYLQRNPESLGSPDVTRTAALVVLLLGGLLTVRFLIQTIILVRTTYVITAVSVEQQYELLFRTHSKGVRFNKVRSHQLNRTRIQELLGYGTITLNRGLGAIRLQNVDDPESVYQTLRKLLQRAG